MKVRHSSHNGIPLYSSRELKCLTVRYPGLIEKLISRYMGSFLLHILQAVIIHILYTSCQVLIQGKILYK